jgi:hypothetical protein
MLGSGGRRRLLGSGGRRCWTRRSADCWIAAEGADCWAAAAAGANDIAGPADAGCRAGPEAKVGVRARTPKTATVEAKVKARIVLVFIGSALGKKRTAEKASLRGGPREVGRSVRARASFAQEVRRRARGERRQSVRLELGGHFSAGHTRGRAFRRREDDSHHDGRQPSRGQAAIARTSSHREDERRSRTGSSARSTLQTSGGRTAIMTTGSHREDWHRSRGRKIPMGGDGKCTSRVHLSLLRRGADRGETTLAHGGPRRPRVGSGLCA